MCREFSPSPRTEKPRYDPRLLPRKVTKEGVLALLQSINALCTKPLPNVAEVFDVWWPHLKPKLDTASAATTSVAPVRTDRELLEELLGIMRPFSDQIGTLTNVILVKRQDLERAIRKAEREYAKRFPDAAEGECWAEIEALQPYLRG